MRRSASYFAAGRATEDVFSPALVQRLAGDIERVHPSFPSRAHANTNSPKSRSNVIRIRFSNVRLLEYARVGQSRIFARDRGNVMPSGAQCVDARQRHVLICEEAHP